MARQTLVLDASVGVKWFSPREESGLNQALAIRDALVSTRALVIVPELFYYEVTNAIVHKKFFTTDMIHSIVTALFALGLRTEPIDAGLLTKAVSISRQIGITAYDSCYIALAAHNNCPLVTANPRHQKQGLGCRVIALEEWVQQ